LDNELLEPQNLNLPIVYTAVITDYGRFSRQQAETTPAEDALKRKRARQAVLKRVRKQRAILIKRLVAKLGRLWR